MYEELANKHDLEKLIADAISENLHLDFKKSDALGKSDGKKREISKDIAAFANSDGGTIIYGMVESNHVASSIDNGVNPDEFSKEWLEQIINSTISPRIDGAIIHPVSLNKTRGGNVAYIVHIPKSLSAPHQSTDNRYYKRFNFVSVPMEHYEVVDVMHRSVGPNLKLLIKETFHHPEQGPDNPSVSLNFSIKNESEDAAEYTALQIYIDNRLDVIDPGELKDDGSIDEVVIGQDRIEVKVLQKNITIPYMLPIWKGVNYTVPPLKLQLPDVSRGDSFLIGYGMSSPGMKTKRGYFVLHAGSHSSRLSDEIDDDDILAQELGL